jgi:hypothetical protein
MTHRTKLAKYFRWTLWLFPMALFLGPQSAWGQDAKLDLSADYSYLRANSSGGGGSFNSQGGNVTATTWNWKPWLGVAVAGYNFSGQPPGVKGRCSPTPPVLACAPGLSALAGSSLLMLWLVMLI